MPIQGDRIPPAKRFEAKVDRTGDCHVWIGGLVAEGYGQFWPGPDAVTAAGWPAKVRAHRWAWEQENGPVPPGMVVMHTCDNPPCVRIDHLKLGTVADNNADARSKRRHAHGERTATKLTEAQVAQIRAARGTATQQALADRYGVSQGMVSHIQNDRKWV